MSRTENSLRNIRFSMFFQGIQIVVTFISRRVFVLVLTQEYLGLNGIFSNILSMLSLAELGIGTAITYSLYKPLAEGNEKLVTALMALFRRAYTIIGLAVVLLGGAITPFLPVLIRDLPDIPHINLIYLLFVMNTSLSYFFVYKQSLIIADQRQYIVTSCHSVLYIILQLAQMLILRSTGNYLAYLGLQIGVTLLENLILSRKADRLYPYIRAGKPEKLYPEVRKEIVKNTKAIILHKIGTIVVFSTDNLLISYFVGVVEVGLYSNYLMLTGALNSIYCQLFGALTASIGNLGISEDSEMSLDVFQKLNFAGNWLYGFSTVCLTVLLNPVVQFWVGAEYLFDQKIVCLIALNFYVTGMRQMVLTFHDANGLYWYTRYKPAAEAAINFVVSAVLAVPLGIVGIFIGTFVSTMATCFWVEPRALFKYGLHSSVKPFFRDYAVNTAVTLLTLGAVWYLSRLLPGEGFLLLAEKAALCVVAGNAGFLLAFWKKDEFRYYIRLAGELLKGRKRRG